MIPEWVHFSLATKRALIRQACDGDGTRESGPPSLQRWRRHATIAEALEILK